MLPCRRLALSKLGQERKPADFFAPSPAILLVQAASREHMRSWRASAQPATHRSRAPRLPTASSVTPITTRCCNASQQRLNEAAGAADATRG